MRIGARGFHSHLRPAGVLVAALAAGALLGGAGRGTSAATSDARAAAKHKTLSPEEIVKRWKDGPARYLMTGEEEASVRKLRTIGDLASFIDAFWLKRDPTPGTLANETRRNFWNRVAEANRRFRDSSAPGWKTDRGKIFILLGDPIEIERDDHPTVDLTPRAGAHTTAADGAGERGRERWHYRRRASIKTSPEFVVVFIRDESGGWRLSNNGALDELNNTLDPRSDLAFSGLGPQAADPTAGNASTSASGDDARATIAGRTRLPATFIASDANRQAFESGGQGARPYSDLDPIAFANVDLGEELTVPTDAELVTGSVSATGFVSAIAATPKFEFFRARDGSSFVNVGALAKTKDLYGETDHGSSTLVVYARLVPSDPTLPPLYASNEKSPASVDLSRGVAPGGEVDAWTGLALAPGRYNVTLAIEDTLTARLGRAEAEIEVPDFSKPGLSLSTPVLASSIEESEGHLVVTPRASAVFRKSESFGITYQVYGLEQASGGARFETSYRFFREVEGTLRPASKPVVFPDRNEAEQAWSLPLAGWPAGRYRIEVTVTDAKGSHVSAQASFEVIE